MGSVRIVLNIIGMDENGIKHKDFPVKVIGISGGACRSIKKMTENPLAGVKYCIVSNDEMDLKLVNDNVLQIGLKSECIPWEIEHYGSYLWFEQCYANEENEEKVKSFIDLSSRKVIIVAGLGGGVGSFGAVWLAEMCQKQNVSVTVVCTIPFDFEGERKRQRALDAIKSIEEAGMPVKVLYADDLIDLHQDLNFCNCFGLLDDYVADTVASMLLRQ